MATVRSRGTSLPIFNVTKTPSMKPGPRPHCRVKVHIIPFKTRLHCTHLEPPCHQRSILTKADVKRASRYIASMPGATSLRGSKRFHSMEPAKEDVILNNVTNVRHHHSSSPSRKRYIDVSARNASRIQFHRDDGIHHGLKKKLSTTLKDDSPVSHSDCRPYFGVRADSQDSPRRTVRFSEPNGNSFAGSWSPWNHSETRPYCIEESFTSLGNSQFSPDTDELPSHSVLDCHLCQEKHFSDSTDSCPLCEQYIKHSVDPLCQLCSKFSDRCKVKQGLANAYHSPCSFANNVHYPRQSGNCHKYSQRTAEPRAVRCHKNHEHCHSGRYVFCHDTRPSFMNIHYEPKNETSHVTGLEAEVNEHMKMKTKNDTNCCSSWKDDEVDVQHLKSDHFKIGVHQSPTHGLQDTCCHHQISRHFLKPTLNDEYKCFCCSEIENNNFWHQSGVGKETPVKKDTGEERKSFEKETGKLGMKHDAKENCSRSTGMVRWGGEQDPSRHVFAGLNGHLGAIYPGGSLDCHNDNDPLKFSAAASNSKRPVQKSMALVDYLL